MSTVVVDFDDTLVGYKKYGRQGEWLPGAREGLTTLLRAGRDVVIFSCRANFGAGLKEIEETLRADSFLERRLLRDQLRVLTGKPMGMVYLDDRALRFEGDWTDLAQQLRAMSR